MMRNKLFFWLIYNLLSIFSLINLNVDVIDVVKFYSKSYY